MMVAKRILIADDDEALREIVRAVLESAGYEIDEAPDGRSALDFVMSNPPDLIILDDVMPHMTGQEVCKKLKEHTVLRHVPIIILTGKIEIQDRVDGLNAGADDYVVKPFEADELVARVSMVIRRTTQNLDANPLTKLPGNNAIHDELNRRIQATESIGACYVDLDQFKAFNDFYGFERGDEIISFAARIILDAIASHGTGIDFIGHIGGDDFLLVTSAEKADGICQEIIDQFDAGIIQFYDKNDRIRGHLLHADRKGQLARIPIMSVSIALVSSEDHELSHPGQIASIGAELKAFAKRSAKSNYVRERRK